MQSLLCPHPLSLPTKTWMSLFFQRPLSNLSYFELLSYLFLSGLATECMVNKNMLSVIFVFLSKLFYLPKSCLCSYKIGIIILCILGWYDPCEVLSVIPDPFGQEPGCESGVWKCQSKTWSRMKDEESGAVSKGHHAKYTSYCTELERRQVIIQKKAQEIRG